MKNYKEIEDLKPVIKELEENNCEPLLIVISGSHAYGTATKTSDVDYRGVYVQATSDVIKYNPYIPQISDENNDITLFEVGRFIELLEKGNPNILELLNVPDGCVVYKNPLFDYYFSDKEKYITKQLRDTFVGYAKTQIKKAKGMNKKIHNPQPKQRKDILEFCYIIDGAKSIPFWKWIRKEFFALELAEDYKTVALATIKHYGLVKVPNGENIYAIYKGGEGSNFRGLIKDLDATDLRLSSIPKEVEDTITVTMWFNLDGFKKHCKDHRDYWKWVEERNPQRYLDNVQSNVNADVKNLMHCVRLVEMAEDIVRKREIIVRRDNREYLLGIRKGKESFENIMEYVENKVSKIDELFLNSDLPDNVDKEYTRDLLLKIRLLNITEPKKSADLPGIGRTTFYIELSEDGIN